MSGFIWKQALNKSAIVIPLDNVLSVSKPLSVLTAFIIWKIFFARRYCILQRCDSHANIITSHLPP